MTVVPSLSMCSLNLLNIIVIHYQVIFPVLLLSRYVLQEKAIGAKTNETSVTYGDREVMLYALGSKCRE